MLPLSFPQGGVVLSQKMRGRSTVVRRPPASDVAVEGRTRKEGGGGGSPVMAGATERWTKPAEAAAGAAWVVHKEIKEGRGGG